MSYLRPKYSLNRAQVEGARATIPAQTFQQLTSRRYPYPRVGTRAPNGMFPKVGNPGHGNLGHNPGLKPHYTLNRTAVQGVMPAETYQRLTGKITTAPELPMVVSTNGMVELNALARRRQGAAIVRAPTALIDPTSIIIGVVAGGLVTLGFIYGIIPALAEWGAAAVKRRY